MPKSYRLKIINILLVLSVVGFGVWLVNKNFPYYGDLIVESVLGKDQPMISKLGPETRVKLFDDYQAILESPVYFDLRSLPWFKTARVYVVFQQSGLTLAGIGGQAGPGWQYDVKEPLVVINEDGEWQKAVFDFDLNKIYQQKNVRRFLISTLPIEGEEKGELRIKSLTIILSR